MNSIKKKDEERNIKIFRELLSFENNRYCFDCNQRGPTYINMTIGSFVCTNCGGALRKYNHRVKSISMSNFSQLEMDFIKKRGNNICRKIYYGLCENNSLPEADIKNGTLDNHLRSKYENKKWYLELTSELEEESLNANQLIFDKVEKEIPKLIKTYTVNSSSNVIIEPPKQTNQNLTSCKGSRTSIDTIESSFTKLKPLDVKNSNDHSKFMEGCSLESDFMTNSNWLTSGNSKIEKTNSLQFDDNFVFTSDIGDNNSIFSKSQTMTFKMPPLTPTQPMTLGKNITQQETLNRELKYTDKYAVVAELDDIFSSLNTNKQCPNEKLFSVNPSTRLVNEKPVNMSWVQQNNQFNDNFVGGTGFNPFTQMVHQQISLTFNPFSPHSDVTHNIHNQLNSPNSVRTIEPTNPFVNSMKPESVKSNNPFL